MKLKGILFPCVIIILVLGLSKSIFAQDFLIGTGLMVPVPGENLQSGVGANAFGEYRFLDDISFRVLSFAYLSFPKRSSNKYFISDSYSLAGFEGSFIYNIFKDSMPKYYGGLGLGYYMPNAAKSGNAVTIGLNSATANKLDNNFGGNLFAGVSWGSSKALFYKLEVKYFYLKTDMTTHMIGLHDEFDIKDKINLSTIVFNLSIVFTI